MSIESKRRSVVGVLIVAAVAVGTSIARQPERSVSTRPAGSQPSDLWDSRGCVDDERGGWFRDAKFGAIIHFGLYSELGGYYEGKGPYRPAEQIMGLGDRRSVISAAEYRAKVGGAFNPAKFDADRWVSLMKDAGQKYVILTTKHHDGFCMFRTATTPYNVVEATPFGRDVVKEVAEACRKHGLVFAVYYSIGDWCAADVQGPAFARTTDGYRDYMYAQLKELLTNYGEIKLLWFDNWWYVNDQWKNDEAHARDIYTFARSINPRMLVNDRCGEGVKSDHGDYATPENQLKGSLQSRYFEVVMTNTDDENWGWVKGATNYRSATELIRNLIDSVSKGGNFVLNVGPNADGEFPPEHVAILKSIGAWTRVNTEALYATIPAPEVAAAAAGEGQFYATKSKDGATVYIHVVEWPANAAPLRVRVQRAGGGAASLLDPGLGALRYSQEPAGPEGGSVYLISRPDKLDPHATVVKLTFGARTRP